MINVNRVPHALLFSGQEQLGKKAMAFEFAKLVITNEKLENHPDFIFIEPLESAKEISISQIRDLIWKLSLRPYSALFKIAIIDQAHLMSREAQNCFLKTLEEPKGNSLLILISEYPETLLPTIISRVQKINFFPVGKNEIKKQLLENKASQSKAEYLSSFCSGRPGKAIELFNDSSKLEKQEKLISDIEKLSSVDIGERFQYVKNILEENYNIKDILDVWLGYFRTFIIGEVREVGEFGGLIKIRKIISLIQNMKYLISTTNVNSRLALEILLMEL